MSFIAANSASICAILSWCFSLTSSYSFLGLLHTQLGEHSKAEESFTSAFTATPKIVEARARAIAEFGIRGHYGRVKFLNGEYDASIVNYKLAINLAQQAGNRFQNKADSDLQQENNYYMFGDKSKTLYELLQMAKPNRTN